MEKPEEKLMALYSQCEKLDNALPADLLKKMELYGQIFELTGKLHAMALGDWKRAEAIRREKLATSYKAADGTVKDKEMEAEAQAAQARQAEADAEEEATRWRNAKDSTSEQIQLFKIMLRDMKDLNNGKI
ncbi:hypothetical protein [Salibacterium lacus]|uniref:Uncharacterized protein n=1 Tax=Salibacterium lacus TaxID=1898109 RepID=A0ABW5SWS1_9BACI